MCLHLPLPLSIIKIDNISELPLRFGPGDAGVQLRREREHHVHHEGRGIAGELYLRRAEPTENRDPWRRDDDLCVRRRREHPVEDHRGIPPSPMGIRTRTGRIS